MPDLAKNLFYHPAYLDIQNHDQLRIFEDDHFRIVFSVENGIATSLPRGLFGSIENFSNGSVSQFSAFIKDMVRQLRKEGVHRIDISHPPDLYIGFVSNQWLKGAGFSERYVDVNHHIELSKFTMHSMEKRKLDKLNEIGMRVQKLGSNLLQEIYDFLTRCRAEKGLKLNISFEKLGKLFQSFPDRYSIFGAFLGNELVSAVIMVQVSDEVVYYYLPGTLEAYKKESPMVGLIDYVVDHFKLKVKYIDLGISSEQGKVQEGLIKFKERMGGIRGEKKSYSWVG